MKFAPWLPVLLPLAVARVTSILVFESIVARPRRRIVAWSEARRDRKTVRRPVEFWNAHPWRKPFAYAAKLVTCPWCVSVWVALIVVAVVLVSAEWAARGLAVPALSLAAMVLEATVDRLEGDTDDDRYEAPPVPDDVAAAFAEEA